MTGNEAGSYGTKVHGQTGWCLKRQVNNFFKSITCMNIGTGFSYSNHPSFLYYSLKDPLLAFNGMELI